MKTLCMTLLLSLVCFASIAQPDNIRQSYLNARNAEGIQNFLALSEQLNLYVAAEKAYRGVALAMYADIAEGLYTKLDYFNRGKELIEAAIKEQPHNPEIRFLRISVQAEAPLMLGYSGAIEDDLHLVYDAFSKGDIHPRHFFWSTALNYILACDEIAEDKRHLFRKFRS